MSYYDLSSDESIGVFSGESEDEESAEKTSTTEEVDLWDRIVVHLDVDCFYCQCEEIDGPPHYKDMPLAIGQKHIIVTSNYVARSYGVKKLQSREAAYVACPSLLILEGSDLEHYRRHSRKIYTAFRKSFEKIALSNSTIVKIQKGGMDENFADITELVRQSQKLVKPKITFVYGDTSSGKSSIAEDQSGAETVVHHQMPNVKSAMDNVHIQHGGNRIQCQERLHTAARICEQVRQEIRQNTKFTTTFGISVSKMLAKLASDLQKPNSINILYPWRTNSVILPMPLRKVPELGSKTMKLLDLCLKENHRSVPTFWTCQDLLRVPYHQIKSCLKDLKSAPSDDSIETFCTALVEKCRGLDRTPIEDDNGGLTKQVSVEDSFRRGSMKTADSVWKATEVLFGRLSRLLDERKLGSPVPCKAFPTTIRLTCRMVDLVRQKLSQKRPYRTQSKQCSFDGKKFLSYSMKERHKMLKMVLTPLIKTLILENAQSPEINLTRLNIATTNFQDLEMKSPPGSKSLLGFTSTRTMPSKLIKDNPSNEPERAKLDKKRSSENINTPLVSSQSKQQVALTASEIDPSILSELPPDIAAEVRLMTGMTTNTPRKTKKKKTIDSFFLRQKR